MSAKPVPLPTPPKDPKAEWTVKEREFFTAHGITDEKEMEVIRKRSLVRAYDRAKAKHEAESAEPSPSPDPKPAKKWYQDED